MPHCQFKSVDAKLSQDPVTKVRWVALHGVALTTHALCATKARCTLGKYKIYPDEARLMWFVALTRNVTLKYKFFTFPLCFCLIVLITLKGLYSGVCLSCICPCALTLSMHISALSDYPSMKRTLSCSVFLSPWLSSCLQPGNITLWFWAVFFLTSNLSNLFYAAPYYRNMQVHWDTICPPGRLTHACVKHLCTQKAQYFKKSQRSNLLNPVLISFKISKPDTFNSMSFWVYVKVTEE